MMVWTEMGLAGRQDGFDLDDLERRSSVDYIEADLCDTDRNIPAPVTERAEPVAREIDLVQRKEIDQLLIWSLTTGMSRTCVGSQPADRERWPPGARNRSCPCGIGAFSGGSLSVATIRTCRADFIVGPKSTSRRPPPIGGMIERGLMCIETRERAQPERERKHRPRRSQRRCSRARPLLRDRLPAARARASTVFAPSRVRAPFKSEGISTVPAYTGSHRTWGCMSKRTLRCCTLRRLLPERGFLIQQAIPAQRRSGVPCWRGRAGSRPRDGRRMTIELFREDAHPRPGVPRPGSGNGMRRSRRADDARRGSRRPIQHDR